MQETSGRKETSVADETSKESLDKQVEDHRAWKEKYEEDQRKELAQDLEPYERSQPANRSASSETLKSSMRGEYEQSAAPALGSPPPPDDPPPPFKAQEPGEATGPLSMSTDLQAAIADAHHLPPEQRAQAVAEMNKKYGKEIANMRTGVLRDGKGVFFIDANGKEFTISYE